MRLSTLRLVSVIDTGSILCEAGEETLYITCLNVDFQSVELYRSTVTMAIVLLHACTVCHSQSLFPTKTDGTHKL